MTNEEDVYLFKVLINAIKEIKNGSLQTQKRIFDQLQKQTKLYEEIKTELRTQNKILERNSNVKINV